MTPALSTRAAPSFDRSGTRLAGRFTVLVVVLAGSFVVVDSVLALGEMPMGWGWLLLMALTWISGFLNLRVPGVPATLSVSEVFVFLQVLMYGGPAAILTVSSDGLLSALLHRDSRLVRVLFNATEPALSVWIATTALSLVGGHAGHIEQTVVGDLVLPVTVLAIVYFLCNSGLTALAISSDTGRSPLGIWRESFGWVSLNYVSGASVALLLVHDARDLTIQGLGVAIPLVLTIYFTLRLWSRRSEAERGHLEKLNRLYLSIVKSLAIAIDAKDSATATHIHRVQVLSLRLAESLGVTNDDELRALETAALLHDVGKLAVPDHILKKPDGLTPGEFEIIKRHPVVGAQMLSAVDFPYPVVPIVRHHHENWNGSGYPDGLMGPAIPLGARILAVIDCYDALTSHRPYRRALTKEEALAVVQERRGRMYDPDVVDAFVGLSHELTEPSAEPTLDVRGHAGAAALVSVVEEAQRSFPQTDAAATVLASCLTLARVADHLQPAQVAELVALELRRATGAKLVMFALLGESLDRLTVHHASGDGAEAVCGITIPVGEGLSGWVAAHGTTILNADPALDLADHGVDLRDSLQSALAVRLAVSGEVLGAVTLCAQGRDAFSADHRQLIEQVADAVAATLRAARCGASGSASPTEGREAEGPAGLVPNRKLVA